MNTLQKFCRIVRARSSENKAAILALMEANLIGNAMSVLRQELDSMVRVIYLLSLSETERNKLIQKTLSGAKWGITDRDMVNISNHCHGWTESVYKFGCAFIHLSQFHDYLSDDPFSKICPNEANDIKEHLHCYHGFPLNNEINAENLRPYLLRIFNKISGNLECYVENLEKGICEDEDPLLLC